MAKGSVFKSSLLLTASGIIAKTIDFAFRAYYSRRLGGVGTGLLSLVFGVHGIMLTFATAGLGVAISKTVSEQLATRNFSAARKTMRCAIAAVSVLSLTVIALTITFSRQISIYFLRDERTAVSLCFLAPSILFMSISYCIKGYFYAARKVIRPASSEFLEQFVKITVISTLLNLWLPKGAEYGCRAVFLGLSIGEFSSCAYLSLLYYIESRQLSGGEKISAIRSLTKLASISLPTSANSLAASFLRAQEDVWIVSGLKFTMPAELAIARYGEIQGMIVPLLVFPLTLFSSFITLLVPEISRAAARGWQERLRSLTIRTMKFACAAGIFVTLIFALFAEPLAERVYGTAEIAQTLRSLAFLCPLMLMDAVAGGILNGLGRQLKMLKYSLIVSFARLAAIYFLVPLGGIHALVAIIAASNILSCALTTAAIRDCGIGNINRGNNVKKTSGGNI